jgi:hypothetical protein
MDGSTPCYRRRALSLDCQNQLSCSTLHCRPPSSSPSWTKQLSCSTLHCRPPSSSPSWTKQLSCSTLYCRRHLSLRTIANWICIHANTSATRVPTQSLHHDVCGLLSQGIQSPSSAVLHLKIIESLGRHVVIPATHTSFWQNCRLRQTTDH